MKVTRARAPMTRYHLDFGSHPDKKKHCAKAYKANQKLSEKLYGKRRSIEKILEQKELEKSMQDVWDE